MKCWKCGATGLPKGSSHHIDGNQDNETATNRITLCPSCHDQVEGICSLCQLHPDCHTRKFRDCWRFEGNIPPIHFRANEERGSMENPIKSDIWNPYLNKRLWTDIYCIKCGEEMEEVGLPNPDVDYVCGICVVALCSNPLYQTSPEEKSWRKSQKRRNMRV